MEKKGNHTFLKFVVGSHVIQENLIHISKEAVKRSSDALRQFPQEVISDEKIVRRRVQTLLRVGLATIFFWLSGLISIGATAMAQAATKQEPAKTKTTARHRNHYKNFKHSSKPNLSMVGTASWYGHEFHNRKTASGKKFNQFALMAAHRTLPFGTLVEVTNNSNHKTCIVEITDRGPYAKNRIIDLSRRAAQELGFMSSGTAQVSLCIIPRETYSSNNLSARKTQASDVLRMPTMALQFAPSEN